MAVSTQSCSSAAVATLGLGGHWLAGRALAPLDRLARQGIVFRNHYIASAMCTPSRAAIYSGQPPQVNGVFDQLEAGYVPSLRKDRPNMGSMMKKLGYQTAFFGKWEMEADLIPPKPTVNYSEALQPYGFDIYQPDGDKPGAPNQGYDTAHVARDLLALLRDLVVAKVCKEPATLLDLADEEVRDVQIVIVDEGDPAAECRIERTPETTPMPVIDPPPGIDLRGSSTSWA